MQAEEDFRSQLRDDLAGRPQPPVGTLAVDALTAGRRIRRRQRTLRAVGGAAAVVAVTAGSVALSGAFGSNTGTAAVSPGNVPATSPTSSKPAPPPASSTASTEASTPGIPSSWTVPAAAKVTDPEWVTPRAIVAEVQKLLPQDASTSTLSGDYAYGGNDPRNMWAVDGALNVTTAKGSVGLSVTLHQFDGVPSGGACRGSDDCVQRLLADGSSVEVQRKWGTDNKGVFVSVMRPDGMSVQATARDASKLGEDELFAIASDPRFASLKMEKSFVQNAESTIKGDFMNPPTF